MIFNLILVVFLSVLLSYFVIRLTNKFDRVMYPRNILSVQRFHTGHVPRIGGAPVFLIFSVAMFLLNIQEGEGVLLILWLASLPIFVAGLVEDLSSKVPPLTRLVFTFVSIAIVFFGLGVDVSFLGFAWIDGLLSSHYIINLLFTLLVMGAAINSLNIIDGFNGLVAGYSIFSLLAIAYVSHLLGDNFIMQLSLILAASISGFFVFNFPFGKIFMGDGGAYFIGFMSATISLILVDRHEELSNWFVLLIFIYPMYELLYSIYRRKIIYKVDASQPDANHLHSLVYRKLISCDRFKHDKVICNSMVSPFMWLLSLVGIIPAVIWFDNQTMLIISAFMFMFIYTIIYKYISSDRFKFNH